MASITSLSNSSYSTSSIYGNRNVLSGLASGMDTESMIENAVAGIKMKITALLQKRTKVEWQQEAYRSIIDKAVNFNQKYTSYASSTNLLSNSFFTSAVLTSTEGTYASKVTASGKTSSEVKINAVKQMATAASYTVSGLGGQMNGELASVVGSTDFDIAGQIPVSTVSGSLTFKYGGSNGTTFDIKFDELEDLNDIEVYNEDGSINKNPSDTAKLAQAIKNKLSEVTYTYTKNGFQETTTADKAIKVVVDPTGTIGFEDGLGNGNSVTISSSTGDIKKYTGSNVIRFGDPLTRDMDTYSYLGNKELSVTLNGVTKKISMAEVIDREGAIDDNDGFVNALNKELEEAFGAGKVKASMTDGKLTLAPKQDGDTMYVGGTAAQALGFESGDGNYINTGKKLTDLLGEKAESVFTQENRLKGAGGATAKSSPNGSIYYVDVDGNRVDKDGYRVDSNGKAIYDFEINGAHINVTEDTTLESLMNSINSNAEAGMKVSYSKITNEFKFTATETGANSKVEFGGLAKALFDPDPDPNIEINHNLADNFEVTVTYGPEVVTVHAGPFDIENFTVTSETTMQDLADAINMGPGVTASYNEKTGEFTVTDQYGEEIEVTFTDRYGFDYKREIEPVVNGKYTAGRDAIMDVEINGKRYENFTRSSNSFDVDGMNITVKGTFNEDGSNVDKDGNTIEPVTFNTVTDSDKIVDAIKSLVEDYNALVTELKEAYSTMPAQQSDGSKYEPLTAEDEEGMTESAIKAYEEKAKQGLLFADSTLSSMYSKLLSAITPGGTDGQTLREIGINTSYSNGLTTLSLDETALRNALESDPDKVRNAFTKTTESGSSSNGLMQSLQNTLNTYVKTTGEPKGVLIAHAGSTKAPTSLNSNTLLSQMNSIDSQIERWQDKMSDQIDRYTTKFTKLEQLIAEMNSQSSALMGLMGGSSSY